jgi:hypothetical protein
MLAQGRGVRALQSKRHIGFPSYQTAWLIGHKIRADLRNRGIRKSIGVVEVDTLHIGGNANNQQAGLSRRGNLLLSTLPHAAQSRAMRAWQDTRRHR